MSSFYTRRKPLGKALIAWKAFSALLATQPGDTLHLVVAELEVEHVEVAL